MANEKRLIDADGFKSAFHVKTKDGDNEILIAHGKVFVAFEVVERALENAPTVDAVEVVHGRNETKQHPVDEFICSVCGYVCQDTHKYVYDEDAEDWSMYEFEFKYCPNCGAKMDGDGND